MVFDLPFHGALENSNVYGLHDQDFVHNGKKLVNPLDSPTRHLILGKEHESLTHIYLAYTSFSVDQHGLREGDIKREDRQNWTAVQSLASTKKCKIVYWNFENVHNIERRGQRVHNTT